MEKSPFRMEISPFWMEKILCWDLFSKKRFKTLLKKKNGEISIQNGDFSILNGETLIICVFFLFPELPGQKKILKKSSPFKKKISVFSTTFEVTNAYFFEKTDAKTLLKKKWMEKSPFRMEISPFKFFSKEFSKKKMKTLLKKVNGEISIQNGDFSIHFFFEKRFASVFSKKISVRYFKSSWKNAYFFFEWRWFFQFFFWPGSSGNKKNTNY